MTTLITLFAIGFLAQEPAAAPAQAPAASDAAVKTDAAASTDVVAQLAKELGITSAQAEGATGAMLGLAKTKLPAADFGKVAATVPNADALIKAAPAVSEKASAAAMAGSLLGAGGMTSLASSFAKLALKPETIAKLAPTLVKLVGVKGGAATGALLAGALK